MKGSAFAAAVGALALAACGHGAKTEVQAKGAPANLRTGIARVGAVPITVSAYGSISGGPNAQASLAFPEPGRIASINVQVGAHVSAGQPLAQLDSGTFDAAVAQASANAEAAQAQYAKVSAGARPQQRAQTGAEIAQARTQLSVAQAQYDRQQQLLHIGVASQADVDSAKAGLASSRSRLRVLQAELSAQVHPLPQDVDAARAQLAQAQAALQAAEQERSYATLTAPFSGIVTARLHSTGESVDSTTPVIELASSQPPTFTAQFDPKDAARIRAGETATITFSDSGTTAAGNVTAVGVAQNAEGRQIPVLIRLTSNGGIGPGAYGRATVRVGTSRGLLVPASALVQDPATGSTLVFRKNGAQYEPVPVEVRETVGRNAWIRSDLLRPNDQIVVGGAAELMSAPQSGGDSD